MGTDARRTFLILGEQVDLFAAVRPLLESEMLQLWWAPPAAVGETLKSCMPWPWGVAGTGQDDCRTVVARVSDLPVLWFWLGNPPGAAPAHTRVHGSWRELAGDVSACVSRSLNGLSLAPNRGLKSRDGRLVLSAGLEGLLCNSPAPMRLSDHSVRQVKRAIARDQVPVRVKREQGLTRLEAGV